jgi:hypothetical protein
MPLKPLKISYILSYILLFLALIASAGGIFMEGLYRDAEWIKNAWFGNDVVTLVIAVPLLALALWFARKGSVRAVILWMGLLSFLLYNYAFYLFGAAFNWFFLLYVALFSLSMYALILGLGNLDVAAIVKEVQWKASFKWISIFLVFISLPLAIVEGSQCIGFITHGKVPEAPALIFALDLSMVVPITALAALLLWRKHPWGYLLGTIMLVKAFAYGLVLCVTTAAVVSFSTNGKWDPLMPFYVFVAAGGLIGCIVLLKNLKSENKGI